MRGLYEREILKENTEKNLVDEWLLKKKEEKSQHICRTAEFSFVSASFEVCVNGPRRVNGRYPSAEAS